MKLFYFILVTAVFSVRVAATEYSYSSIFYNDKLILSMSDMEATFIEEKESFDIVACSTSEFDCFYTFGMAFSVPKMKIATDMSWEHKDYTYKVGNYVSGASSALGVGYFAIHSAKPTQEPVCIFLYSEQKGLIGMRFVDGPHRGTIWLVKSDKGFPK